MDGYAWLEFADGTLMRREVELTIRQVARGEVRITNKDAVEFGPIPGSAITATIMGVTDDPAEGERYPFEPSVQEGDTLRFPGA